MTHTRTSLFAVVAALIVLWLLSGPTWFASGVFGRAMTDVDIWAQIHLPYPVLTLLLVGFLLTTAALWFRRHVAEEHAKEMWDRKR